MSVLAVLIPTYKPSKYLVECLQSIEGQTLNKSDFKVYIALNGPRCGFEEYVLSVLNQFTFDSQYFFLPEAGVSYARNQLIDRSEEYFLVFLDDDDVISPTYLKELLSVSCSDVLGVSNVLSFKENINDAHLNYVGRAFSRMNDVEASKLKGRKYFSSIGGKMLNRDMVGSTRFDKSLSMGEDSFFMAQLAVRVRCLRKTSNAACYYVRLRPGSVTRSKVVRADEFRRLTYLLFKYSRMLFCPDHNKMFVLTRVLATIKQAKRLL